MHWMGNAVYSEAQANRVNIAYRCGVRHIIPYRLDRHKALGVSVEGCNAAARRRCITGNVIYARWLRECMRPFSAIPRR